MKTALLAGVAVLLLAGSAQAAEKCVNPDGTQDPVCAELNWPPFRPDTRHSSEGLGISSSTCLCRTTISGLN